MIRHKAYVPYSGFKVGAALLSSEGALHLGVNVESASYGLTLCAERNAIFSAITLGMRKIQAIAIIANTTGPVSPCGACRQIIAEFSTKSTVVILCNTKGDIATYSVNDILPFAFTLP